MAFVELDAVLAQQLAVFLLKCPRTMVRWLLLNVALLSDRGMARMMTEPVEVNRAFSANEFFLTKTWGVAPG